LQIAASYYRDVFWYSESSILNSRQGPDSHRIVAAKNSVGLEFKFK
jgi:hypothetical protein